MLWAFGDARGRGFVMGATAGRTTLNGEGLQHQDGHSTLIASCLPSCLSYDPAFVFEVATIIQEGLRRMWDEDQDVLYYITLYNENYAQEAMPDGVRDGILAGIYPFRPTPLAPGEARHRARLVGSGPILLGVLGAQQILAERYGVAADVYSATSWSELRRDALAVERWNRLHPGEPPRVPWVTSCLEQGEGPVVVASDFMKALPDGLARWIPGELTSLGTDGYGRSDTRPALRRHFEVDAEHVVVATLSALLRAGEVDEELVAGAIREFGIDPEAPDPQYA
jgi:pyruvate dehydrogenase E1 component